MKLLDILDLWKLHYEQKLEQDMEASEPGAQCCTSGMNLSSIVFQFDISSSVDVEGFPDSVTDETEYQKADDGRNFLMKTSECCMRC
jgi:hypothetical protein